MSDNPSPDRIPPEFEQELATLLNRHGIDGYCSMPDHLLARYLRNHLQALRSMLEQAHRDYSVESLLSFNYGPRPETEPTPPPGWTMEPKQTGDTYWRLYDLEGRAHLGAWLDRRWYRIWPIREDRVVERQPELTHFGNGLNAAFCGSKLGWRSLSITLVDCPDCLTLAYLQ